MKKILVLGGGGYVGVELISHLIKKNFYVYCVDKFIYKKNSFIQNSKKVKILNLDITDNSFCKNMPSDISSIIILAGLVGDPITKKYPELSQQINYTAIRKIINFYKNLKVKLIFVSTCSNYGFLENKIANEKTTLNPKSLYAKQKVKIEKYIISLKKKSEFTPVILRFSTAFGVSNRPRFDLTINEFVLYAVTRKKLQIYDHETWRPYCHLKDFANVIQKCIEVDKKKINYQIFNVGDYKNNFQKIEIAKLIKKHIPSFKYDIVKTKNDPRNYVVNFDKIKAKLNIKKFVSVEMGIIEMIEYLKKQKNIKKFFKFGNYKVRR
tara:strand:+ start:2671 stop:3639 length:969 start_codon:yes stop_codon:yes gene_type:complete